jgi:hypothetical protein
LTPGQKHANACKILLTSVTPKVTFLHPFEEAVMKHSSGPRKTANLSESVHHQLDMYALAASTTGVSLLALAQPAAAKIIYTPAKVGIRVGMSYNLDLNRDGISDFRLGVYYTAITQNGTGTRIYDLYVRALQKPNAAVIGNRGFARAFRPGITVGPKQVFGPGTFSTTMAGCRNGRAQTSRGPWLNVQNRYLGLRFTINGRIHYGWARLTTTGCPLSGTLTGYAYETVPNSAHPDW